jgi:hypothetical protein
MNYADDVTTLSSSHPDVAQTISRFVTLEHILDWMKREGHPLGSLDMVTQDEFCHDLLLPIGPDWLVFGMT